MNVKYRNWDKHLNELSVLIRSPYSSPPGSPHHEDSDEECKICLDTLAENRKLKMCPANNHLCDGCLCLHCVKQSVLFERCQASHRSIATEEALEASPMLYAMKWIRTERGRHMELRQQYASRLQRVQQLQPHQP